MLARRNSPVMRSGFPMLHSRWPIVGHLPKMLLDVEALFRDGQRDMGNVFWVYGGFGVYSLVWASSDVMTALLNKATTSSHFEIIAEPFLGGTMIAKDGEAHRHMRGAMQGSFTPRGLTAAEVGPILAELIQARVNTWVDLKQIRVLRETRELALNLIFRMIGIPEADLSQWRHQYEEYVLAAINIPFEFIGTPRWRGKRARTWLDARLQKLLEQSRANPDAKGLLADLARAVDEDGKPLADHELIPNLRLLALAGHETTASTMAWMALHLTQDKKLWDDLQLEAMAGDGVPKTVKELKNFPLAEALFRECLRIHPPVPQDSRRVTGDLQIEGRTVPIGTDIMIPLTLLAQDPNVYDNPTEFRVGRWLEKKVNLTPIELSQFGAGPHFCLGYHVAWMEAVQFAVAFARTLNEHKLRPQLVGKWPKTRYLPLTHPAPGTRIEFVSA